MSIICTANHKKGVRVHAEEINKEKDTLRNSSNNRNVKISKWWTVYLLESWQSEVQTSFTQSHTSYPALITLFYLCIAQFTAKEIRNFNLVKEPPVFAIATMIELSCAEILLKERKKFHLISIEPLLSNCQLVLTSKKDMVDGGKTSSSTSRQLPLLAISFAYSGEHSKTSLRLWFRSKIAVFHFDVFHEWHA